MKHPVMFIDLVSFLAVIVTLIVLWRGWKRALPREVKLMLAGYLALTLLNTLSNVLEWGGITKALDPFEDFFEILMPTFWFLIIYAFFKNIDDHDLRESERKLKESHEIARLGQWELDLVSNKLYWSDGIYNIFKMDPDESDPSYEAFLSPKISEI